MKEEFDQSVFGIPVYSWAEVLIGLGSISLLSKLAQRLSGSHVADTATRYRSRNFITFFAYLAGFAVNAAVFSNRLDQMVVAFGVIGADNAFAVQEVIASVAGCVATSYGRFFAPSDRIQLGGIPGDEIDIGVLRTTLMKCSERVKSDVYNGRIVRVANGFVFKEPV